MSAEPRPPDAMSPAGSGPQRLFLHEPGWRVALKVGSERVFCYMMAPGQDYYHRLLDGEIYLHHGDERLCLACAERRGLLSYAPKGLREPRPADELELSPGEPGSEFDLIYREKDRGPR